MIKILAKKLSNEQREFMRDAVKFAFNHMVKTKQRRDFTISVVFKDMKGLIGETVYRKCYYRRLFTVYLDSKQIKKNRKTNLKKFEDVLKTLFHEMVHVKQYLQEEIKEDVYKDGSVLYNGKKFKDADTSDLEYWDKPWEIEAYGREIGLYKRFEKAYKENIAKL